MNDFTSGDALADLEAYWMPFTANRAFKQSPKLLATSDGMFFQTHDGRAVLDGTAGLWCCNAGHNRKPIVEAIQRQAARLDYGPQFQVSHEAAFELASRLTQLAPPGFSHAFFCNSGSEAVDTALKIALAYHRARGQAGRTRLIGRERGYHGVGFGGISVGGITANRRTFGPLMTGVDHLRHTHDPRRNSWSRGQPPYGAELADDLERLVNLHDASTIAAVVVEPIACSTGVLVPPVGYLERLQSICDRHGILLIFDEVITGFGRVGASFAAQRFGVMPDIITMAKGLTNGAVPMGGVLAREGIFDAISEDAGSGIELFHGYTYSGHPLACAAALATLDVYRDELLFERSAELAPDLEAAAHALRGVRHVTDVRNFGLIAAFELDERPGAIGARGMEVFHRCYERGVLVRATGDIIAISPPLIATPEHFVTICQTIAEVLSEVD